ncbi:MAG: FimV/HubP family polar landmark protein [Luteimonas sp.]
MTSKLFRSALAIALALVSAQAAALGLGQIEVRSRINEPLLAEIPVIYSDPSELEQLQARLASPETFVRVGLDPPRGTVADLQFAVALDARGQTVIRVTSSQPVNTSLLVFLVEVDSGQSRVVREYSALIDAPRNAPVASGPVIWAPQVAMPNTVTRPPVVSAPPVPPMPSAPSPDAAPANAAPPVAVQPNPDAVPVAPTPVAVAPEPRVAAPAPGIPPAEYGPVKSGQTLSQIAGELGSGYSLDQTMIALLRANPDAFIGEDINFIKRGAVLRVPQPAEISGLSQSEASVLVQSQVERWREARQPAPQPVEAASTDTAARSSAAPATPSARRVANARLEIVPSASRRGTQAGTRSGASAGGEGEMLRQQLQQNKEDLAARDAEVVELQTRIAELEKLQQQQGQLLTLKDSELAAAQQRLAESNRGSAAAPVATATAAEAVRPGPETSARDMGWVWPLGVVVLALAALLGWWFSRRRVTETPTRRSFDTQSLAAGFPAATPSVPEVQPVRAAPELSVAPVKPGRATRRPATGNGKRTPSAAPMPAVGTADGVTSAPVAAVQEIEPATSAPAWTSAGFPAPTWHAGNAPLPASTPVTPATTPKSPLGHESIELARAYIDLGDHDTARSLLQEVIDIGDAEARTAAANMLRDLP